MTSRVLKKIVAIGIMAAVLVGCGEKDGEQSPEIVKEVEIITAKEGLPNGLNVRKSSTLEAKSEFQVIAEGGGRAVEVLFDIGDEVEKNQVLVVLGESLSNTQNQVNQSQAVLSLDNARQALESTRSQATEAIRQAEISMENAQSAYDNAVKNKDNTLISLEENEKAAKLSIETAEILLNNTRISSEQSIDATYEDAITNANSALTSAEDTMRQLNIVLAVEKENTDLNRSYRDMLGATNPQILIEAENNYQKARDIDMEKVESNIPETDIAEMLSRVEDYLRAVIDTADETDLLLKNTIASQVLSQNEIDNLRSIIAGHNTTTTSKLATIERSRQLIDSAKITSDSSLDSALKGRESAEQQLQTTLAANNVQRENLNHAVLTAERNLTNAESTFKAAQENAKNSVIAAENAFNTAQQQYDLATLTQSSKKIKAPIAGKITSRDVDLGELVSIGSPIATIAFLDELKIVVNFTYSESQYLENEGAVAVYIDGNETEPVWGKILRVSPTADPVTRQIEVEIAVPNVEERLKPNLMAEVQIPFQSEFFAEKILLPIKAVRIGQEEKNILVIGEENAVSELPVVTGPVYGDYIQVIGIDDGQEVIGDIGNLQIGEKVKNKTMQNKQEEPTDQN